MSRGSLTLLDHLCLVMSSIDRGGRVFQSFKASKKVGFVFENLLRSGSSYSNFATSDDGVNSEVFFKE